MLWMVNRLVRIVPGVSDFFEFLAKKVFDRAWGGPYKPPSRGHGALVFNRALTSGEEQTRRSFSQGFPGEFSEVKCLCLFVLCGLVDDPSMDEDGPAAFPVWKEVVGRPSGRVRPSVLGSASLVRLKALVLFDIVV